MNCGILLDDPILYLLLKSVEVHINNIIRRCGIGVVSDNIEISTEDSQCWFHG